MRIWRWSALIVLLVLLFPAPALADDGNPPGGQVVLGRDYALSAGERLEDGLLVFGGDVTLEEDSVVDGSVVVMGGDVDVAGTVEGDLSALGGNIYLRGTAVVNGDLMVSGGQVERDEGAQVRGEVTTMPWSTVTPWQTWGWGTSGPVQPWRMWGIHGGAGPVLQLLLVFLRYALTVLLMAGLAALVAVLWPQPAARVGQTLWRSPLASLGVGLLSVLVVVVLVLSLCLTLAGLVAGLVLVVAAVFGWVALGILVGQRVMASLTPRSISPFWSAALGAGLLTLLGGLLRLIPCAGRLVTLLVAIAGLGAVLLSRFGAATWPATPPAPPAGGRGS